MSLAHERFSFYNHQLIELLQSTARKREKGLAFYSGGARNIIFRLEGLCRLYRTVGNKKFFDQWYKEFKALEDTLGAMDHLDAMQKEFSTYKPLKTSANKILGAQLINETGFLEDVLKGNDWLSGEKMKAFTDALNEYEWKSDEEDTFDVAEGMALELQKLEEKYRTGEIDLSLLEDGLHEYRRRLRWVSIYAASANGIVQLKPVKIYGDEFKKYCTKDITTSPFNTMAKAPKGPQPIRVQAQHFYAMSWLINHLGELKDVALRTENFEMLCVAANVKDKKLTEKFHTTCKYIPTDVTALSELAVDNFMHRDYVMERLQRDFLRHLAKEE
jgi:hypothetical protein